MHTFIRAIFRLDKAEKEFHFPYQKVQWLPPCLFSLTDRLFLALTAWGPQTGNSTTQAEHTERTIIEPVHGRHFDMS